MRVSLHSAIAPSMYVHCTGGGEYIAILRIESCDMKHRIVWKGVIDVGGGG